MLWISTVGPYFSSWSVPCQLAVAGSEVSGWEDLSTWVKVQLVQTVPGAWNWPQDVNWRFGDFITSSRTWTSLLVQWIRIHQPMQDTQVRSLVWGESTGCGPTKPGHHNYWSPSALETVLDSKRSTTARSPCTATKRSPRLPHLEKSPCSNKDPVQPKINKNYCFLKCSSFSGSQMQVWEIREQAVTISMAFKQI